jgi:LPXTG-site transpeptidase (sortase) family protein
VSGAYGIQATVYETPTTALPVAPAVNDESVKPYDYQLAAYTSIQGMERADGSIGTVRIPSLGIDMKVWEGETNASMAKGLGHYSSTSAWDGNVCVCGHNRGASYVIGSIKDLEIGDTVTYTTIYGTRTYAVSYVGVISYTDWSHLQATADNRITLTTCLANQPSSRVCVQAVEVV